MGLKVQLFTFSKWVTSYSYFYLHISMLLPNHYAEILLQLPKKWFKSMRTLFFMLRQHEHINGWKRKHRGERLIKVEKETDWIWFFSELQLELLVTFLRYVTSLHFLCKKVTSYSNAIWLHYVSTPGKTFLVTVP